jgi:hypothetical protein
MSVGCATIAEQLPTDIIGTYQVLFVLLLLRMSK